MQNGLKLTVWTAALSGSLIATLCAVGIAGAEDKGKEEKEVKVALKDLPDAVRATLEKEAQGAKLEDIDKETEKSKVIYEADVKINGHNYEIKVAEDGLLLSKKLDDEEEKNEKNEKGENK